MAIVGKCRCPITKYYISVAYADDGAGSSYYLLYVYLSASAFHSHEKVKFGPKPPKAGNYVLLYVARDSTVNLV